jgi:predicted nucleotide-binding protein
VVFIGHGRSAAWRDLKDFLSDRLGLAYEEFNREPAAGISTIDRLRAMLDKATFALLVMTAEDAHEDGEWHARENVIHEAGLFQGRLGFQRAIVLIEEGCAEFSNIHGLGQIRFPRGNIIAVSEEVRRVLERERVLSGKSPSPRAEGTAATLAGGRAKGAPGKQGNIAVRTGALSGSSISVHVGDKTTHKR